MSSGTRVVVRRVLPGETGPVRRAGDDRRARRLHGLGRRRLRGRAGVRRTPVTIRIADIVSGKPVPPRPSPRLRVSARDAQVRGFALFPDLVVVPVAGPSGWLLRSSATATARRANSVLAFPGGVTRAGPRSRLSRRTTRAREAGGRGCARRVGGAVLLAGLGWVPESHDADTRVPAGVRGVRPTCAADAWTTPPSRWSRRDDGHGDGPGAGAGASRRTPTTGSASAASRSRRSTGVRASARTVMAALLEWGAERGATTAYLQVLGRQRTGSRSLRRPGLHDPPRLRVPDAAALSRRRRHTTVPVDRGNSATGQVFGRRDSRTRHSRRASRSVACPRRR